MLIEWRTYHQERTILHYVTTNIYLAKRMLVYIFQWRIRRLATLLSLMTNLRYKHERNQIMQTVINRIKDDPKFINDVGDIYDAAEEWRDIYVDRYPSVLVEAFIFSKIYVQDITPYVMLIANNVVGSKTADKFVRFLCKVAIPNNMNARAMVNCREEFTSFSATTQEMIEQFIIRSRDPFSLLKYYHYIRPKDEIFEILKQIPVSEMVKDFDGDYLKEQTWRTC